MTAAKTFFPLSDPDRNYLRAHGRIVDPKSGDSIGRNFVASGTAGKVETGVYLWLAVQIGDNIWPKEGGLSVTNGQWCLDSSEKGQADQFELSLWAANQKANDVLQVWRDHCVQHSDCPGSPPPTDMIRLDRVLNLHMAGDSKRRCP